MSTHLSTGQYRTTIARLWRAFLSLIFPLSCAGCETEHTALCNACLSRMPRAPDTPNKEVWSAFDYRNPIVRKAVWLLKYRGNEEIADVFAAAIYDKLLEDLHEQQTFLQFGDPLLIPIPLSDKRKRNRGFNQSEMLMRAIAETDHTHSFIPTADILIKIKDTPSQVSIKDRARRLRNIKGCFAVTSPEKIIGKSIILIDDVTTTGATLHEARRVLIDAGASVVIARTIAH